MGHWDTAVREGMNADTTIMALLDENTVTLLGGGKKLYEVDRTRL